MVGSIIQGGEEMEWIAVAIVFCFLMWRWPKKTVIGICICSSICLIFIGSILGIEKYNQYKQNCLAKKLTILSIEPKGFFIDGARRAGYSDKEILNYIINSEDFKLRFKYISLPPKPTDALNKIYNLYNGYCEIERPLFVKIKNESNEDITNFDILVNIAAKGRSSTIGSERFKLDYILQPEEEKRFCFRIPQWESGITYDNIDIHVSVDNVISSN